MQNLLISVIFSVFIANIIKYYQKSNSINFINIFFGNYLIACVFSLLQNKGSYELIIHWDIILAIINGILFLLTFFIFQKNIKLNGISLSVSMMRLALIIPTVLSLILFKEYLSLYKYLIIIGIIFLIYSLAKHDKKIKLSWLVFLFSLSGIIDFSMKVFDSYGQNTPQLFLFVLFLSAFITNTFIIIYNKIKFSYSDFFKGMILGVPNQLTSIFLLKALTVIPGTIAYPLHASSIIVLSISADLIMWKERIDKKRALTYLLLVLCIVGLNI